jgi:hypothetical protein
VVACPNQACDSSMLTLRWLIRLAKEVRSSRGGPAVADFGRGADSLNIFRTLPASSAAPLWVVLTGLAFEESAKRFHRRRGRLSQAVGS